MSHYTHLIYIPIKVRFTWTVSTRSQNPGAYGIMCILVFVVLHAFDATQKKHFRAMASRPDAVSKHCRENVPLYFLNTNARLIFCALESQIMFNPKFNVLNYTEIYTN